MGNLTALGAWFLSQAGYIELKDAKWLSAQSIPLIQLDLEIESWLSRVTELLAPSVDRLDQLPERASLIFNYDADAALAAPDNAEVLAWPNTDAVFARFTVKILEDESATAAQLTPERFKQIVNEVKAETGAKGKGTFSSHSHRHYRLALRAGVRQTDSHPRRRQPAEAAQARAQRARASGRVREAKSRRELGIYGVTSTCLELA